jgi:hypothetical protein
MHARHNRASQRREKAKENKREKKCGREHKKAECTQAKTRSISATAEESARKCEAETKENPEIHGQDSLKPTHGRPRCIENGDFSERVFCWGGGGGGGFFTGEPFLTIFTLPLFTWIQLFLFFFVFFGVRHFAKM